jgi:acetyl esterase/lipase
MNRSGILVAKGFAGLVVMLTLTYTEPIVFAQSPQQALPEGTKVFRDLAYVENGHERQRLDLYVPQKAKGPLPVIIWIHGGAWSGGSKAGPGQALAFIEKGYAVASIGYRLSQHAIFPAQAEDCKSAIRWLRANAKTYQLDSNHFAAWGASAGGHLAALVGTAGDAKELEGNGGNLEQSSRVQAVVDFFGPTDFLQMESHAVSGAALKHNPANSPESRLVGGAIQENPGKVQMANPIRYVTKDDPPFFIAHGELDPLVPWHQSQLLYEALHQAGVDVSFVKIPEASHGGPQFSTEQMQSDVLAFFEKHLKAHTNGEAEAPSPSR